MRCCRGGNPCILHQRFGEPLGGLDRRSCTRWPEDLSACCSELIDDAESEGTFRSDDREIHLRPFCECQQPADIVGLYGNAFAELTDSGVSGSAGQLDRGIVTPDLPADGMLPPTVA